MNKTLHRQAAAAALALAAFTAQGAPVVVDVSGAQSINLQGEAGNTVWFIDIGAHAVLHALDWSVTLQAFEPSLLSDMQLSFGDSSGLDAINLAPDVFDGFSGSGIYSGALDLTGWGIAAGADGLLRLEFSETFKDFAAGVAEGQWLSGTLTFDVSTAAVAVPEPGIAALASLGLGLLALRARRRESGAGHAAGRAMPR